MKEIGFWDYTCPRHGSLERYTQADWDLLLDDMASGGFNSLVLGIKWLTTGYRSRLPWLDQDPSCSAIASENALIYYALRGARQRGLRTWLLVVATIYPAGNLALPGGVPYASEWVDGFQVYDLDTPGIADRIDLLFGEVVDLFGNDTDGIVVEVEFCDGEAPHRIPIYNQWAQQNGRPSFAEIKHVRLEPRAYPFTHWRDFTTSRRIETMQRIENCIRSGGFQGKLASIIEIENQPAAILGNVNLKMLHAAFPHWPVVTYDSTYDRRLNRLASMDFCIHQPHLAGLDAYFLTRGVMTFKIPPWFGPTTLEEQWRLSLEDAKAHRPDVLWFMGCDARLDGMVCSNVKLPEWGFADPRTARLRLMQMAADGYGIHTVTVYTPSRCTHRQHPRKSFMSKLLSTLRLTSRQRMLRTIGYLEIDYIPCCFMSFTALRKRCQENMVALARAERDMGLDAMLFIPVAARPQRIEHPDLRGLPVLFHPDVKTSIQRVTVQGNEDQLHREFITPGGNLTASCSLTTDWPHGDHLPFIDDYQVSRSLKPLITQPDDLNALQYLLELPRKETIEQFNQEAQEALQFSEALGVLLVGGWGVGMDMVCWLLGIHQAMVLSMTQPSFVSDLLEMIHVWNLARMQVVLSASVDLYIRRAWYEGCDFLTPKFFREEILPRLKREVDLVHNYGAKFGYICTSGTKPMLDYYLEAGIDVLIGVDPIQGTYTDMPFLKTRLDQRYCLWGGVSGAITVEMGNEQEIRAAVRDAIETLGPKGFILSPVDNITLDTPKTWQNINIFIDEWRKHR